MRIFYPAILLVLFLIFPARTFACQCSKASYKFVSRIKKAEFVGYVEVINHDTVNDHPRDWDFTIVRVIRQFKGPNVRQEISIRNGGDVDCTQSLAYPIGSRFIIKARFEDRKDFEFDFDDLNRVPTNIYEDSILVISACSQSIIKVEGNIASGYISQNRGRANYSLGKILSTTTFGLIKTKNYKRGGWQNHPQKMEISKVLFIIERKTKDLS